jgi:hypothetical protein
LLQQLGKYEMEFHILEKSELSYETIIEFLNGIILTLSHVDYMLCDIDEMMVLKMEFLGRMAIVGTLEP